MNTATPATATLTFTFTAGGDIAAPAVVTQGVANLDFTDAGTGTCTTNGISHSYSADQTCTVVVDFTPKLAGTRYGAVNLYDASGSAIAFGYVYGIGVGPQVNFLPGTESTILPGGPSVPNGVAADDGGAVYIADWSQGRVLKETPAAGGYTQSVVVPAVTEPTGVAIDGSGNLYVVAWSIGGILKETWNGSSYVQSTIGSGMSLANSIATDGSGNVYVADSGNNRILLETPSQGGYTQSVLFIGGGNPSGVAIDAAGNLYLTGYESSQILEFSPSTNGYTQNATIGSGFGQPSGIAIDGVGDLYVADTLNSRIVKETLSGGSYTQSSVTTGGLDWPWGVGVDHRGNVYISDTYHNRVVEEDLFDAPVLSFSRTAAGKTSSDSPQTVTVENIGNEPLSMPVPAEGNNPAISANFRLNSTRAGACPVISSGSEAAGSLAVGSSCVLAISFAPQAIYGKVSGSLELTDDALNATSPSYAVQTVALSGTGTANPPLGAISQPIDATTRATSVGQIDSVRIMGWAADPQEGAPVSQVSVLIDGTAVGNATLGLLRPDVAAAQDDSAYLDSGWTITYPAASLAIGKHAVTAVITDSLGLSTTLGPRSFSVAAAAVAGAPFGAIGQPMDAVTHATTVAQADSLVVDGWAADAHDGAPVASVSVLIDGSAAGNATLGIARPDVAAGQGSAYLDSGWTFTYSAAGLSVGSHTVSAMATDSLGNSTQFATKAFTVSATQVAGPPFGSLGKAVDATTGLTTVSASDNLLVAGWAADFHDGAPVAGVTVLIDGAAVGAATLGVARPDVVQGLGKPAYLHAGWTFSYPASGLSAGAHTVTAVAADSLGMSTQLEIRGFTVSP